VTSQFVHLVRHGEAGADGRLTAAGREQADLLAARLSTTPLTAVHHSPLLRAVETAQHVARALPRATMTASPLLSDHYPPVPSREHLPPPYRAFLDQVTDDDLRRGAELASAALQEFAGPRSDIDPDLAPAIDRDVDRDADRDVDPTVGTGAVGASHALLVTHAFQVAWFVRDALGAPPERWLGLNCGNASLTTILYRPDRPPSLVMFNDMGHLPEALRWTGFPRQLRP
jgi:probable phosphoglycerate mutase